ncbi:hypothetical protein EVAR_5013_1 [Eumeta japonica]|uniref:Uncharacterized protein n=1 Tax=Eumeta variegata TaxID=151549 RepID=A0A4C1STV6_EUMVA|nr:hypothetical protein EVAR_5013_1 [Eumeta japonica]
MKDVCKRCAQAASLVKAITDKEERLRTDHGILVASEEIPDLDCTDDVVKGHLDKTGCQRTVIRTSVKQTAYRNDWKNTSTPRTCSSRSVRILLVPSIHVHGRRRRCIPSIRSLGARAGRAPIGDVPSISVRHLGYTPKTNGECRP